MEPDSAVVALADLNSRQLARRAAIIETVTEMIVDVGAEVVQMRDVAQRSGVALATVYRYFSSKDQLLAAALEDWQKRLTRRITGPVGAGGSLTTDPTDGVLDYLRRALRAFHRNPRMTALMLQTMTSNDAEARTALEHMRRTNNELFGRLLEGVAPEDVSHLTFGINAALSNALSGLLTDMMSYDEAVRSVEWVARSLLAGSAPPPR